MPYDILRSSVSQNKNQNKMRKNKNGSNLFKRHSARLYVSLLAAGALLLVGVPKIAHAVSCSTTTDCQSQINSLTNQNSQTEQSLSSLELQAQGYQGAIDSLNSQISNLQQEISSNEAEQTNLNQQIVANEQEITSEKATLADDVKTIYVDGQMTTLEELASSKNLSDFVDKQEYRSVVQNQLTQIIQRITALEATLQSQKTQVSNLLTAENTQNSQLASAQSQQSQLLSMNQSQQTAYNSQVSTNKAEIAQLQKQQAAIIQANTIAVKLKSTSGTSSGSGSISVPSASSGSGGACDNGNGNGGYPMAWCNAAQDSITTSGGFPNRECTSYAYWYFTSIEGHSDFYDTGNANQWLNNSNYATHSSPAVGAIAVETAGTYGHVAIIQGLPGQTVDGDTVLSGYVLVSEMNYDWNGHFRYSYSPLTKFAGYIY